MKKLYILFGIILSYHAFSQSMGNINSSATNNNSVIFSVGEIYVIPSDPEKISSGTLGLTYQTTLNFLGINELIDGEIKVYPNPTTQFLFFTVKSKIKITEVQIFDLSGKSISNLKVVDNVVDLSFLQKGIYLIYIKNSEIKPIKIIKN